MIVAHQAEHAAMARGAGHVAVAEDVAGPVDAWALAVPEREDAVIFALAGELGLLRAPDRGGGEVLVEAGLEDDIGGLELLGGPLKLLVEPAERRAAIAGDEAGGVQARTPVAFVLDQQHAGDGLRAGQEDLLLGKVVFVVERDGSELRLTRRVALRSLLRTGHGRPPDDRAQIDYRDR